MSRLTDHDWLNISFTVLTRLQTQTNNSVQVVQWIVISVSSEVLLMSTCSICFCERIRKISITFFLWKKEKKKRLIWSTGSTSIFVACLYFFIALDKSLFQPKSSDIFLIFPQKDVKSCH